MASHTFWTTVMGWHALVTFKQILFFSYMPVSTDFFSSESRFKVPVSDDEPDFLDVYSSFFAWKKYKNLVFPKSFACSGFF